MNLLNRLKGITWYTGSLKRDIIPSTSPPTYRTGQICVIILNSDKHSKNYTYVCDRLLFLSPLDLYFIPSVILDIAGQYIYTKTIEFWDFMLYHLSEWYQYRISEDH